MNENSSGALGIPECMQPDGGGTFIVISPANTDLINVRQSVVFLITSLMLYI
jgi:hypothetical protein